MHSYRALKTHLTHIFIGRCKFVWHLFIHKFLFHLLTHLFVSNVFSMHDISVQNVQTYEWTNFTWFSLLICRMLNLWCVWLFIVLFIYKIKYCLISWLFLCVIWCVDEFWIGGQKQFMEATTIASLDPTLTLSIEGVGCHRYWPIGAQ